MRAPLLHASWQNRNGQPVLSRTPPCPRSPQVLTDFKSDFKADFAALSSKVEASSAKVDASLQETARVRAIGERLEKEVDNLERRR